MSCLLAIGACYLDTIMTLERYPAEDEKLRMSSIARRRGGNCPNTLEVLGQLLVTKDYLDPPISLVLACVLPSPSSLGAQQIIASFGSMVNLSHCIYRSNCGEAASSYIMRSCATGSRTIVNYNELPEMDLEEFVAITGKLKHNLGWCHFEGRIPNVTLDCMRYLRQHFKAVHISVEVEKPTREGLQALAAEADVVFYSKSWAQANGHKTPEECLRAQATLTSKASLLCCTWGDQGASALELPSLNYSHVPAYVDGKLSVIDTIGAGDTFIAGMLYSLTCHANDWVLEHRLSFANELAGRKVVQEGFSGLGNLMQADC